MTDLHADLLTGLRLGWRPLGVVALLLVGLTVSGWAVGYLQGSKAAEVRATKAEREAIEATGRADAAAESARRAKADEAQARAQVADADALLFIGACGIAVRAIAPLCRDKTVDPAVLVMDEMGRHIIPILSGHIGGANDLALLLAERTGAEPVLTTATDVRGVPAIDSWAMKNDCAIENKAAIQAVSAAALAGKSVGVAITEREIRPPFPVTLFLRPRTLTLGVGCKRGTDAAHLEDCFRAFLHENGVSPLSVRAVATIDVKKDEAAILALCEKYRFPLQTYSAAELNAVPGVFAHSDFVMKTVGCGCVCERAAVMTGGRLLVGKTAMQGVTLALAGEENV